jgi:hypothetical protein
MEGGRHLWCEQCRNLAQGSGMHGRGVGGLSRELRHNFSRMERNEIPETTMESWKFANLLPFWQRMTMDVTEYHGIIWYSRQPRHGFLDGDGQACNRL